ncbi:MAG: hypothetical protein V1792_18700 [Pseudomonadota bacterium]
MKRRFIDLFKKNVWICPRRLLLYLITGAFLCFPNPGMTNQTPLHVVGGGAMPKSQHETVRMDSEQVVIRLGRRSYTVDAIFHLFNAGETVTEWVGFPKRRVKLIPQGLTPPDFVRFDTWVDGRHVEVSELRDAQAHVSLWEHLVSLRYRVDRLIYLFPGHGPMRNEWMGHRVTFARHAKTTIRTIYEAEYGYRKAFYIFGTGRYWKDGIGKATFVIDCTDVGGTRKVDVCFPVAPGPKILSENVISFNVKKLKPPPDAQIDISVHAR